MTTRPTPTRMDEIDKELKILSMWFCSDYIKELVVDLNAERIALTAERDALKEALDKLCQKK